MAYVGNAILPETQIDGDEVEESWLASWGHRCSNGREGHLGCAAIVGYESSSGEDVPSANTDLAYKG